MQSVTVFAIKSSLFSFKFESSLLLIEELDDLIDRLILVIL